MTDISNFKLKSLEYLVSFSKILNDSINMCVVLRRDENVIWWTRKCDRERGIENDGRDDEIVLTNR